MTLVTFPLTQMAQVTLVTFPLTQMALVTLVTFPLTQMALVTMMTAIAKIPHHSGPRHDVLIALSGSRNRGGAGVRATNHPSPHASPALTRPAVDTLAPAS